MQQTELGRARHALRGRLNALKLCVSALEIIDSPADAVEFLDYIAAGADKTCAALDEFEVASDREPSASARPQ